MKYVEALSVLCAAIVISTACLGAHIYRWELITANATLIMWITISAFWRSRADGE